MDIIIVAAVSSNGVIGIDGRLPWILPSDLRHFKNITKDKAVIMGRATFESIGSKPLPNRYNIVVSKTLSKVNTFPNLTVVDSLDAALWAADNDEYKEVFVIGGAQLYKEALGIASKLTLTLVDTIVRGSNLTIFPYFKSNLWTMIPSPLNSNERSQKDECEYEIVDYVRKSESSLYLGYGSIVGSSPIYPTTTTGTLGGHSMTVGGSSLGYFTSAAEPHEVRGSVSWDMDFDTHPAGKPKCEPPDEY